MFKKFVHFISLRYTKTRKVTRFAIGGIAVGVMVLIIVISVMDGFIKEFKSKLQGSLSDIIVTVRDYRLTYSNIESVVKQHPNVRSCSPHLDGLVLIGTGHYYAGAKVLGIDYEKEYEVGKLRNYLVTSYKSKKLWAEKVFEDNVNRSSKQVINWTVKDVYAQEKGGVYPEGTTVICEERVTHQSKNAESKEHDTSKIIMSLVSFTFNENNKIIFIEDDLPKEVLEESSELSEETKKKWQKFFNKMAKNFSKRELALYMENFDENLRTYNGEILGAVDPQNPFFLEEQGVRPVIMGHNLMKSLQLKRGDEIGLMTGRREDGELKPFSRTFIVAGSFRSGWQEIDSQMCYTRRSDLRGFIDWPSDVKEICVALKDPSLAEKTKYELHDELAKYNSQRGFRVEQWEDRRRTFLSAIQLERTVMKYILFFVVLLAVATIMIILVLLVKEKTKDIGILRSMGASSNEVMWIFLLNGALISFWGSLIGCGLGCFISANVNVIADFIFECTGFRVFPRDIYYLDQIPSELNLYNVLGIVLPTLILSIVFCAVPALKAAEKEPVEALNGFESNKKKKRRFGKLFLIYRLITSPFYFGWYFATKMMQKDIDKSITKINSNFFAAEKLNKYYQMGSQNLRILNELNFKVTPAKITAIIGSSGAGKSTLLYQLGLLDSATSGKIYLEGIDANSLSASQRCKMLNSKVGFIFQFYHLFPEFTALENVLIASMIEHSTFSWQKVKKQKKEEAITLLTKFGLQDRLTHLPNQLSGGERQRVAIARALINNPKIVLCDEPTGNLDEENSKSIQDLIWELNEQYQQTFVIVTHDLDIARKAHEVYRLEQGKLVRKSADNLT